LNHLSELEVEVLGSSAQDLGGLVRSDALAFHEDARVHSTIAAAKIRASPGIMASVDVA
jgi:hypothetical protein